MASHRIQVSVTEATQFRRLVAFLEDVEEHATATGDQGLVEAVEACRADLLDMSVAGGSSSYCFVCGKPMPDASENANCWAVPGRGSAHADCWTDDE